MVEIVNEVIATMGQCVLHTVLAHDIMALWLSIVVDEATDVLIVNKCSCQLGGWITVRTFMATPSASFNF